MSKGKTPTSFFLYPFGFGQLPDEVFNDMADTSYWGYRINTDYPDFFYAELQQGRLRQGWGYEEGQNLRLKTIDKGALRNLRMLNVKKDDILLIPRIPEWGYITIARATEDWSTGYRFEISSDQGDYGHIFPAEYICQVPISDANIQQLYSTFHYHGRFWKINHWEKVIQTIIKCYSI